MESLNTVKNLSPRIVCSRLNRNFIVAQPVFMELFQNKLGSPIALYLSGCFDFILLKKVISMANQINTIAINTENNIDS